MKFRKFLSLLMAIACVAGTTACSFKLEVTDDPSSTAESSTSESSTSDTASSEASSSDSASEEKSVYELYAETPVEYTKLTATDEDENLSLWFDHGFAKTVRSTTTSSGRDTYKMYMGKNEKEDCQFFLSSASDKSFSVQVSDFTLQGSSESVPVSLYYEYYHTMPYGGEESAEVPDAIPSVTDGQVFTLSGNTSLGFVLQARTSSSTAAGEYTATLNIYDENDRQIKTATVFLHVWDFEISDNTTCRTAMWADKNFMLGMDYKDVYDFLLDNRVNAYDLPYDLDDPRVDEYLNNPRVNSFNILGYKKYVKISGYSEANIKKAMTAAYAKLSQNEEWFKKGYFYMVDEPTSITDLAQIKEYGEWLAECYPGYRQMSPFFTDKWSNDEKTQDWIEYLRDYIQIWVPKTYAYTTLRQYASITNAKCLYLEGQESKIDKLFGSYPKRIKDMVENDGDEAWWYVTSQPSDPYITFNTTEKGVAYRVLFWQQKMNGVTGLLYWSVNYWSYDIDECWGSCEGSWSAGNVTYGNGRLIYPGSKVGSSLPVGSLRLEAIRDGIEDYEMLTMLEKLVGTDKVNELINRTTTHVAIWNDDEDSFAAERIILGNYLEALSK